jgi:hypothetical protein
MAAQFHTPIMFVSHCLPAFDLLNVLTGIRTG